jgi:hypothetical protein
MANTTVNDVLDFITSGRMSDADRARICRTLNEVAQTKTRLAAARWYPGASVEFNGKYGELIKGRITKVNRTTVFVAAEGGGRWRVSPTLLRASDGVTHA